MEEGTIEVDVRWPWLGRPLGKLAITVDGAFGRLPNDKTHSFRVAPGMHVVTVRPDGLFATATIAVSVAANETVRLTYQARKFFPFLGARLVDGRLPEGPPEARVVKR